MSSRFEHLFSFKYFLREEGGEIVTMVIKAEPSGDDHILSPGATLGRAEKIKYFDELQTRYANMVEQFASYEKKCEYLEQEVKLAELRNLAKKRKIDSGRKSFGGMEGSTGNYEEIGEDPTIPPGWKSCWRTMEGFSQGTRTKSYFAPNGRYCQSRLNALNYMVTDLKSSPEDVKLMREALKEEGWRDNDDLPKGWMVGDGRKNGKEKATTKRFSTEEYINLGSLKLAVKHLLLHFPEEELTKFLSTFVLRSNIDFSFSFYNVFVSEARQSCWSMLGQALFLFPGKLQKLVLQPVSACSSLARMGPAIASGALAGRTWRRPAPWPSR